MNSRNLTMTVITVLGLIFISGSGCSKKDKAAKKLAAELRTELDAKQKELDCKVAALAKTCTSGDTKCDADKQAALAACNTIAPSSNPTSTVTATATATN